MKKPRTSLAGTLIRMRNYAFGLDRYRDPLSYFGPGGLDEAEAICTEANRDLLAYIRPPERVEPQGLRCEVSVTTSHGPQVEDWSLDSPLPSGIAVNDRVHVRLYRPNAQPFDRVVLFHHPAYAGHWHIWRWFLAPLISEVPVAMVAGPHHHQRREPGRFPGEGTINPNPARLFETMRQWSWDHQAVVTALHDRLGLRPAAEIGFSLGAFQTLLLASAGRIDLPIVSIAATNRYAFGLTEGIMAYGLLHGMVKAGFDRDRLFAWTDSIQLERYVTCLRGRPVLYVFGEFDRVDPPPSLSRLEEALQPTARLALRGGHATLLFYRRRILEKTLSFLQEHADLPQLGTRLGKDPVEVLNNRVSG